MSVREKVNSMGVRNKVKLQWCNFFRRARRLRSTKFFQMVVVHFLQVRQPVLGKHVVHCNLNHIIYIESHLVGLGIINGVIKRRVCKLVLLLADLEIVHTRACVVQGLVRFQTFVRKTAESDDHDSAELITMGTIGS